MGGSGSLAGAGPAEPLSPAGWRGRRERERELQYSGRDSNPDGPKARRFQGAWAPRKMGPSEEDATGKPRENPWNRGVLGAMAGAIVKVAERGAVRAAPLVGGGFPALIDLRVWAGSFSPEQRKDSDAPNRVAAGNELSGDDLPTIPRGGVEFIGCIVHADLHHLEFPFGHRASRRRGWLTTAKPTRPQSYCGGRVASGFLRER
jgi:hypothetical protein